MPVIRESQTNSIQYSLPEVYIIEREPAASVRGASTNIAGLVCQTTRGKTDTIYEVGSMEEFSRVLGNYKDGLDGYLYAKNFFDANGGVLHIVRVTSSGTAAASYTASGSEAGSGGVFSITADSVGTWGNDIVLSIATGSTTGLINVSVRNGKELRLYDNVSTDSTSTRYVANIINEDSTKFFSISMILSDGTLPTVGNFNLAGGSNGATTGSSLADDAYVGTEVGSDRTGIQKFKEDDEILIILSARNNDTINAALITHVNNLTLSPRRTILTLAAGTSVTNAITYAQGLDDDKVKIMYPRLTVRNPFTKQNDTDVNPTSFAAAIETLIPYNRSGSQVILPATVIGVEKTLTNTEMVSLTKNQINPIFRKKGRGFIYGSDYTTSKNPLLSENAWRRAKDFFAISFETSIQPYKSRDIDSQLWADMRNALSAFLDNEASARRIGKSDGSRPYSVKIDSDNNPQSVVQSNRVIIEVEISLKGLANTILIYLDSSPDKTIVNS